MKCLVLFDAKPELQDYLNKGVEGVEFVFSKGEEETVMAHAATADLCIGWRPSQEFLKSASNLKLFINPGAGMKKLIEWIQEADCVDQFTVVNGHGNAFYTAEHAVAMLLSVTNGLVPHHEEMKKGKWRLGDEHFKSRSLRGMRMGLVGYGHINKFVETMLKPFGCTFQCYTTLTEASLESFAEESDVLIIAAPHTQNTENMVNADVLSALGADGILINVGRGPLVEEDALFQWLKQNPEALAGIDVWYEYEPEEIDGQKRPHDFPFHELPNILLSPHRGASPFDDLKRWDDVIENVNRFAQGRTDLINVVNLSAGY